MLRLAGACAAAALAGGARAEAPAPAPADAGQPAQLEEVVVTAGRPGSFAYDAVQTGAFRNARVLDTPLTVNVVPRAVLDAQGAQGLYDALRNTGGVTRSQLSGAAYDNIAIRGILVENRGNYRLNGGLPVINLVEQPLENKERIEVLKGASGLYYGFVPPSGVINMTTKRARGFTAEGLVRGDGHGTLIAAADLGGRFGPDGRFGARVNLAGGDVATGVDFVEGERGLAAVALDWDVSDRLGLKFDAELIHKDIAEPAALALPAAGPDGRIVLPEIPDPETNLAGAGWLRYDANAENFLLRADYRVNDAVALMAEAGRARTFRERAFSQFENYSLLTGEGTLRIFLNPGQEYANDYLRAEASAALGAGPLRHELTLGFTRNRREQSGRGNQIVAVAQNLYAPRPVAPREITALLPLNPSTITDEGVYLLDRIRWGERWQLLAGLRRSDYRSASTVAGRAQVYTAEETSPALALIYQPVETVSLYATYLEGLEEGGTAPANAANAFEVLPPAVAEQWEAGAKAELAAGLIASVAYFEITRPSAFRNAQNLFVLDGETEYRGVELVASGELTPDLSVVASALWLDASLERASDPRLIGARPENTAEWTGSVFAEWRPPLRPDLALNAGVFYVGDRAVNVQNQAEADGYATLTLGARYEAEVAGRNLSFQVNVDNATDETYWNAAGNGLLGVGAPRTVQFRVAAAL